MLPVLENWLKARFVVFKVIGASVVRTHPVSLFTVPVSMNVKAFGLASALVLKSEALVSIHGVDTLPKSVTI